jgi:hypothetical protein
LFIFNKGLIKTIAGTGEAGNNGDYELATNVMIHYPMGIVFDYLSGSLFFSDFKNNRICVLTLNDSSATPTTYNPTFYPTSVPSSTPTSISTSYPTSVPSSKPTSIPTSYPTNVPSSKPTSIPTSYSTNVPSSKPTSIPTSYPTNVPSSTPTSIPTSYSTNVPSSTPTSIPTSYPTSVPSSKPTSIPTSYPTSVPSSTPTSIPTSYPTKLPTSKPTSIPTSYPTNVPSSTPTSIPTSYPTKLPTSTPTLLPTVASGYKLISTYAGTGVGSYSGDNRNATNSTLHTPYGLVTDTIGNLYIVDRDNHAVRNINKITNIITTIAGTGVSGYNGDNIQATSAMLNTPYDLSVDSIGNFYIADTWNFLIRKVNATTKKLTNLAGNRNNAFSGDNGPATSASIGVAYGLTLDVQQQNLYFTDNLRIRKIDLLTNIITTFAGTGKKLSNGAAYNGENVLATSVDLLQPMGVRFDYNGSFLYYINHSNDHRIRKINMKTNLVNTVAGNGGIGYNGENIAATNANLANILFLSINEFDDVYIAERYYSHRIRKIDAVTGFLNFKYSLILNLTFYIFIKYY